MMRIDPIPLGEIRDARDRIAGLAIRTPLLRLNDPNAPLVKYHHFHPQYHLHYHHLATNQEYLEVAEHKEN